MSEELKNEQIQETVETSVEETQNQEPLALSVAVPTAVTMWNDVKLMNYSFRTAKMLCSSALVPDTYRNSPENCLVAIDLANRLGLSPLMVMQNLNVIYGRPSWSAQYVIAMINSSGKYDFELQFDEKTDKNGKPFSCQCWTEKNGRKVTGPVIDMDMAKAEGWLGKAGSKWQTMPQMMLRYRAASFFGRMNCPELTMGIYTREEVIEIGPDEYETVMVSPIAEVESQARENIEENANKVVFEEKEVAVNADPIQESVPEPVSEPQKPPKGRHKKTEPVPQTVEVEDDGPEWE